MKRNVLVVGALVLGLVACKKDGADKGAAGKKTVATALPPELRRQAVAVDPARLAAPAVFAYVPADTAYMIGSFEPIPLEYYDTLFGTIGPAIGKALDQRAAAAAAASADPGQPADAVADPGQPELIDAIRAELDGKWSVAGLESLGLSAQPHFAIYGLPLVPVVARLDVKDDKAVLATIQRIASRAGRTLPAAETRDGRSFWRFVKDKSTFIVALLDNQLVVAAGPSDVVDQKLALVLGSEKPAQTMADGKALAQVMTDHGYAPYVIGFLDSRKLIDASVAVARADPSDDDPPSDACVGELQRMAGRVPRVVLGYDELTAKRQSMSFVVELAPDLLAEVAALRTEVPGLGTALANRPLMAFGGGVDIVAAQRFLIGAMQSWNRVYVTCEMGKKKGKADLAEGLAAVSRPLPPELARLTGGVMTVQDVAFSPGKPLPDKIEGFLLVSSSDAKALYAAAIAKEPKLAQLGIRTDGKLREIPRSKLPMPFTVTAGVGDHALALGVGPRGKELGEQMLGASGGGKVPFAAFTYDYARLIELSTQVRRMQGITTPADDLNLALARIFSRGAMTLDTSDRGLVFWASLEAK